MELALSNQLDDPLWPSLCPYPPPILTLGLSPLLPPQTATSQQPWSSLALWSKCLLLMDSLTPKACGWGGGGGSCLITVDSTDVKFPRRRQTLSWQVLLPTTKWAYPENSIFYIPAHSTILHSSQDKPIKIMFFTGKPLCRPTFHYGDNGMVSGKHLPG